MRVPLLYSIKKDTKSKQIVNIEGDYGVYTNGENDEDGDEECGENDKGEGVCGDDFFFWIVADDGEKALVEL